MCFAAMAESSQRKGKCVWFLVHRRELLEQTVATFDRFGIPRTSIHIGMVATVANHLDRYPPPDFIIFDEAHFSAAATWGKIIAAFPDAFIVGLTGSPLRLDGKPLGAIYDSMVVGISARELIEQGYLAPYRYFAPAVADLSALGRRGTDYDREQAAEMLAQRAVFGDVIQHYREHAGGLQAICYCATVRHSEEMAAAFCEAGIAAVHFDGNTPAGRRRQIVQAFRDGEITILCNCDLVSCGFDVPDCHCCILLRPTMSTALNIQQSMRALRPQDGKTAIILDHVNNHLRHGLPDDDRAWSLDSRMKPRREYGEDGKLLIRQCPMCYHTYRAALACPNCGHVAELTRQEMKHIKAIRLEEVKRERVDRANEAVKGIESISACRNLNEIMAWCKKNGKSSGYGYYVAKRKGWLR